MPQFKKALNSATSKLEKELPRLERLEERLGETKTGRRISAGVEAVLAQQ
jgi:hypothetical protein